MSALQIPPYPVWRFTVEQYHRLIDAGELTEDDPVELLEGWIVPKMPHNPRHDSTLDKAEDVLRGCLPAGWRLRVQKSITTLDSEPEPDIAIVRGPAERYRKRHPGPRDVATLVEVSNGSLRRDRTGKGRLYARAGIDIYWIINLIDGWIEVYTEPTGPIAVPRYQTRVDYKRRLAVPLLIGGKMIAEVPVRELLG